MLLRVIRQQRDFSELIGRPVDLGTPQALSPYIRQEVMDSAEPIYDVDGIYSEKEQAYAEKAGQRRPAPAGHAGRG